jgi:hypothetical protein
MASIRPKVGGSRTVIRADFFKIDGAIPDDDAGLDYLEAERAQTFGIV